MRGWSTWLVSVAGQRGWPTWLASVLVMVSRLVCSPVGRPAVQHGARCQQCSPLQLWCSGAAYDTAASTWCAAAPARCTPKFVSTSLAGLQCALSTNGDTADRSPETITQGSARLRRRTSFTTMRAATPEPATHVVTILCSSVKIQVDIVINDNVQRDHKSCHHKSTPCWMSQGHPVW